MVVVTRTVSTTGARKPCPGFRATGSGRGSGVDAEPPADAAGDAAESETGPGPEADAWGDCDAVAPEHATTKRPPIAVTVRIAAGYQPWARFFRHIGGAAHQSDMPRTLPFAVALALVPSLLSASADAKPTAAASSSHASRPKASASPRPQARPKARPKMMKIPRARVRARAVEPVVDAKATRKLASLLRAYVEGGSTTFEKRVVRAMENRPGSRASAARILGRIDRATRSQRRATLGPAGSGKAEGKKGGLNESVSVSDAHGADLQHLRPAITLPPQGVSPPTTFTLRQVGLVTVSTEDADGADELTTLSFLVTPAGDSFDVRMVQLGSDEAIPVGTTPVSRSVYAGPPSDAVLITALIDDDGGNAAAAAEDLETLVALSASVASTLTGQDRIAVFKTMLDYTVALDSVGSDPSRAARSVVATPIAKGDWAGLWSADPVAGATPYKVAIPHRMGTGQYELLLDLPSQLPPMTTVRLQLSAFTAPAWAPMHQEVSGVTLRASIAGESHVFPAPPTGLMPLERKVTAGDVEIKVSGTVHYRTIFPQSVLRKCRPVPNRPASWTASRCRTAKKDFAKRRGLTKTRELDLAGPGSVFTTTYSTALGGFKPTASSKPDTSQQPGTTPQPGLAPIRSRTASGKEAPFGSVKLTATDS